jgi:hypothetical protein
MNGKSGLRSLLLLVFLLAAVLLVLFHKSFVPGQALFSNDGPLGVQVSRPLQMPQAFFGIWNDNYWLGAYNGFYVPNFSGLIYAVSPHIARANFYAPISVLVLGLCSWVFFRRMGCNSRAAILSALAAALNMNFMSNAGWGLGSRGLSLGAAFLALAAIETGMVIHPILTSALAGLAIGLSITEGGDNGAIFSIFIGFYALWRTWIANPMRGKAATFAIGKAAVMVVFAAIMASQTLGFFLRTSVTGVVGTQQDTQTKGQKWDFATQWSLPKIETLRVIIPGLFGYRMDTPEGGNYWGRVGEAPSAPQQMPRYSGAGEYAGVIVVLIALWAVVESSRSKGQGFTLTERKLIWFWAVMAFIAMLLGWGRHAPFYQAVYALPYFSTIRNPMKFFHAFHMCVMILFAYGLLGMSRRFLDAPTKPAASISGQLRVWWSKPSAEKSWTWASIAAVALSAVAWFGYVGSRSSLVKHLQAVGFPDRDVATQIAKFSSQEVLFFVLFLVVSVAIVTLVISGALAGSKAKWAGLLIGMVLVVDLARANKPWLIYYDWKAKYASNPVIDVLKEKAHEHRVTVLPFQLSQQFGMMQQYYHVEWLQHHFPYYGVQSIDIPQEPRVPADKQAYRESIKAISRLWQLTNTRYLLGMAGSLADMLNQQLDPEQKRFRQHTAFTLFQKPDSDLIGVETNATGPFALLEFTGALPRARLYNNWETIADEKALLTRLGDAAWDPAKSILLSQEAPRPTSPDAVPGKAEILANPSTKVMEIQTTSEVPAMLLVNDKIEPEWHAYIDGKKADVLRANYLVRAIHVPAGTHKVTLKYEMKPTGFFIVLACDILGLALLGIVAWSARRRGSMTPATA